ncbi:MAG: helix-turn-helix domain-containing protein [Dehalococcoidia bacterium]|nr:helix-turn-helix domain-containing protein [Dehalococcoidia bacterium]
MLRLHSHQVPTQDKDQTGWLDKYVEEYELDADYVAEGLALRLIEQAISTMGDKGISRSDLASLMGVSRSHITRMLNAPSNLTLRSIAQLAGALGMKTELRLVAPSLETRGEPETASGDEAQANLETSDATASEGGRPGVARKGRNTSLDKKRPVSRLRVSDGGDVEATVKFAEPVALFAQEHSDAETALAIFVYTLQSCLLTHDLDSLHEALGHYIEVRGIVLEAILRVKGLIP